MRMTPFNPGRKPTLLALMVSAACWPVMAATSNSNSTDQPTLTVTAAPQADFTAGGNDPVPAYLDGQVAHGGRLGMLGEQKAMDVPFNVIGFTAKMIQDQQAQTIADVVRNDAGVQNVKGYGNFAESYRIRGFKLDGDAMTYGGLAGIVPRQVMDASMIERVEIFKGANALLNGSAESGVGGMINLEPKHADDLPLTRVAVDYTSGSQVGASTDIGRRFGDNDQFGVRFNAVNREGGTEIDGEKKRTTAASLGLDYRGDRLRTSLDMGYQKKTFHHAVNGINISGIDFIPAVPKNGRNYSQPWIFSDIESEFGLAKAEYDLTDSWTAYAALGAQHTHEVGNYGTPKIEDAAGNATIGRFQTNRIQDNMSGMAGLRGTFTTGPVTHKVNVGYAAMTANAKNSYRMSSGNDAATNIYDTDDVAQPATVFAGGDKFGDPLTTYRSRSQGYLLSDTLGFFDDRLLATLGARHQKVVVRNYGYDGKEDTGTRFDSARWLPAYGLLYKATENLSLYANHTESLTPGTAAPFGTDNYGSVTGIVHAKQNEVGVKADFGRIGGSLALFEIKQPVGIKNNNVYQLTGEQRNRGVELNVFGEPLLGLRLNGSTTWIDPDMTKTGDSNQDGKNAIGVPRFTAALGAEYDIKPVDGLTATALLNYTGSQYANLANTMKLDAYTTLDLGLRYRMKLKQNDVVWRVGVDNVTNEKYWANVDDSGTYLTQGEPRTVKVSMSYDF